MIRKLRLRQKNSFVIKALFPLIRFSNSSLCPVQDIIRAFTLTPETGPNSQAVYYQEQHRIISVLTYKCFMTLLKYFLSELGLDPHDYGTYFLCRGGVSFALEIRALLDTISTMGDWKSDSICLCLHMSLTQHLSSQRLTASDISTLP